MKFNKSIFKISLFLKLLTISAFNLAMESDTNDTEVIVINQNRDQNIEEYIKTSHSCISIFGATLRYSFFDRYQKMLNEHVAKLIEQRKKKIDTRNRLNQRKDRSEYPKNAATQKLPRRIKHVNRSIAEPTCQIMETLFDVSFEDFLKNLEPKLRFQMFFQFGLQQDTIYDNFLNLIQRTIYLSENYKSEATDSNSTHYLIHVLMPCYFNDVASYLDNGSLTYELLEEFLIESANFYKALYQKAVYKKNINNLKIIILIPELTYIKQLIKNAKHEESYQKMVTDEKIENIANVLYEEVLLKLGQENTYILINPALEQIKPVEDTLLSKGFNGKIISAGLSVYSGAKQINTFFPYVLRRTKKYTDFRITPLINQNFADFIKNIKKEK